MGCPAGETLRIVFTGHSLGPIGHDLGGMSPACGDDNIEKQSTLTIAGFRLQVFVMGAADEAPED